MDIYEFKVLRVLSERKLTQREVAELTKFSLGKVNQSINALIDCGFINDGYEITKEGHRELSKYKVNNAIIMAAGMSSRFAPLSYENPKGLLKVKGEVLIERQIRQLHERGITDITIVLGYMKEKFFYLSEKFGVNIVINEDYYRYNNTSTLMLVLDKLKNTYICSSDNYFVENVFNEYEFVATYPVQLHDISEDGEYYATFNKQGEILDIDIGSGEYCMVGHVYFDSTFSKNFSDLLVKEYEKEETKTKLWEKVYVEHLDDFCMYAEEYSPDIIKEFDSLEELQEFDEYYLKNTDSKIFNNIMKQLGCKLSEISNIEPVKDGLTNLSVKFDVKGVSYIYRHPGVGTDEYINRKSEYYAQNKAKELELDNSYIFMDPIEGWKLSYYIEEAQKMDYHNTKEVTQALKMIKDLHDLNIQGDFEFNIWAKTLEFIEKISKKGRTDFHDFDDLFNLIDNVKNYADQDGIQKRLCHCDFYDPNILISTDSMYLIDWEYAGVDDPGVDLGTFIACSDYTYDEAMKILDIYEGFIMEPCKRRHFIAYIAIASYYWFIWAIFQESNGAAVGEYLHIWYNNSYLYGNKAIELYEEQA